MLDENEYAIDRKSTITAFYTEQAIKNQVGQQASWPNDLRFRTVGFIIMTAFSDKIKQPQYGGITIEAA